MGIFRNYKINRCLEEISSYVNRMYIPPKVDVTTKLNQSNEFKELRRSDIRYSLSPTMYSLKKTKEPKGTCTENEADIILRGFFATDNYEAATEEIEKLLKDTFTQRVMYYVRAKGLKDPDVYTRGGIDRRLYSKIMSDLEYKPSKDTAIAIAIGLRLTVEEAGELLARAGYVLSHSIKRDLVIEYFLREGKSDIRFINEVLDRLGMKTIGRME